MGMTAKGANLPSRWLNSMANQFGTCGGNWIQERCVEIRDTHREASRRGTAQHLADVQIYACSLAQRKLLILNGFGGEGGIRTHGTVAHTPHFECGAFDHSATSPLGILLAGQVPASVGRGALAVRFDVA